MKKLRIVLWSVLVSILALTSLMIGHAQSTIDHELTFSISYDGNNWTSYTPDVFTFSGFDKTYLSLDENQDALYLRIDSFIVDDQLLGVSDIDIGFQNAWGNYALKLDADKSVKIPMSILKQERDAYSYLSIQSIGKNHTASIDFGEKSGIPFDYSIFNGTYVDSNNNSIVIDENGKVRIPEMTSSDSHLDAWHIIDSDGTVQYNHQLYVYTFSSCLLFDYDQENSVITFNQVISHTGNEPIPDFLSQGAVFKKEIPATSLSLNKTKLYLEKGKETQLQATLSPIEATSQIVWESSDPSIASVNQEGVIQALREGNVEMTASSSQQSATCQLTVIAPIDIAKPPVIDETKDQLQITTDEKSLQQLDKLLQSIINDDVKAGTMSPETLDAIEQALQSGQKVSVEMNAKLVDDSDVDTSEINKIDALLKHMSDQNKNHLEVLQYLDLGIEFKTGNTVLGNVSLLPEKIEWMIKVPQELIHSQRRFYMIRIHDGQAESLPVTIHGDQISFQTDRFSTYAIAYADKTSLTNEHTVTFVDMNNHVIKTINVQHGQAVIPPAAPDMEGYVFERWDGNYQNITSDITLKAIYQKVDLNNDTTHAKKQNSVNTDDTTSFAFIPLILSMLGLLYYQKTKKDYR